MKGPEQRSRNTVDDGFGISRRDFVKGVAAGAVVGAGGSVGLGAIPALAQEDPPSRLVDFDLVNGKFVDGRGVVASEISIRGGRLAAVGQANARGAAQRVNLRGHTVIPGLIDAHVHFSRTGTNVGYETRWVETAFSIAELQEVIAERALTVPPGPPPDGGVITASGGWTPNQFAEARPPTRAELNEAAPNHAVYLSGRTNDLGAAFFETFGITVDENGQVSSTGEATAALRSIQGFEDKVRGTRDIIAYAAEAGLTGIHDTGNVNVQPGDAPPQIVRADHTPMNALYHRSGRRLNTRMRFYLWSTAVTPEELHAFIQNPIIREAGDEFARVNGLGEQSGPDDLFLEALRGAARAQWRVQQHFGPAAPQFQAFQTVAQEFDLADLRWSWGHAGTLSDDQIQAHAASGIGVTLTRGPARSWIDSGIRAGAATDATNVSWISPWMQIYFFTTRRNQLGNLVLDGQQISRLEALHLYTLGSAWFSREDHELGSFDVGKKADMVVLNNDYLTVSDQQLLKTRSLLTLLGGRPVHAAGVFARMAEPQEEPFPDRFPESIEL